MQSQIKLNSKINQKHMFLTSETGIRKFNTPPRFLVHDSNKNCRATVIRSGNAQLFSQLFKTVFG